MYNCGVNLLLFLMQCLILFNETAECCIVGTYDENVQERAVSYLGVLIRKVLRPLLVNL